MHVGSILGAVPSVIGYFTSAGLNANAIRQISIIVYYVGRQAHQLVVTEMGSRVVWNDVPSLIGLSMSAAAYGITLTGGAIAAHLFPQLNSEALLCPLIEGTDGAVGTLIRGRRTDTRLVAGRGKLSCPKIRETAHGAAVRTVGSCVVHQLDLGVKLLKLPEESIKASVADRLTSVATTYNPWVAVESKQGLAELFHTHSWDLVACDPEALRVTCSS
jgi:insecticidal toxin complex protein TccC